MTEMEDAVYGHRTHSVRDLIERVDEMCVCAAGARISATMCIFKDSVQHGGHE